MSGRLVHVMFGIMVVYLVCAVEVELWRCQTAVCSTPNHDM